MNQAGSDAASRVDAPVQRAAAVIAAHRPGFRPQVGLVLGSGLDEVASAMTGASVLSYRDLPGFPQPTVPGHAGRLVLGHLGSVAVACLSGRQHLYEGAGLTGITTAVRCLRLLGCEALVQTCAAGSLRPETGPGSLMIVTDHLNLLGANPLTGANDDGFGPRFPSMAGAWDAGLAHLLRRAGARLGIPLAEGVYAAMPGPSFETPAEVRMLGRLGADAVGMSMVPECIVARHCGLAVVGCAVITNFAEGVGRDPIDHGRTLAEAAAAATKVGRLLAGFLEDLNHDRAWNQPSGAG